MDILNSDLLMTSMWHVRLRARADHTKQHRIQAHDISLDTIHNDLDISQPRGHVLEHSKHNRLDRNKM